MTKKKYNMMIILITGALIIYLGFFLKLRTPGNWGRIVAIVNGEKIPYSRYLEIIQDAPKDMTENEKKMALDFLVNQKVIEIYAKKSGLVERELRDKFEAQEENAKNNLLVQTYIKKNIEDKTKISSKEMKDYFKNTTILNLYAIAISKAEENALQKIEVANMALDKGKDFFVIQSQFNDPSLRTSKGFLGYVEKDNPKDLPEPFLTYSKNLKKPGDHSHFFDAVKSYMILYRGENPSYNKIKANIKNKLLTKKKKELWDRTIKRLSKNIKIDKDFLARLPYMSKSEIAASKYSYKKIITFQNNIKPIFFSTFKEKYSNAVGNLDFSISTFNKLTDFANKIALNKIFLNQAEKQKIAKTRLFKDNWKHHLNKIKAEENNQIVSYVLNNLDIKVNDKELEEYFYKHKKELRKPNFYKLQKIVVKNKDEADKIYGSLKNNDNFAKAVKKYSKEENIKFTKGITQYLSIEDLKDAYLPISKLAINEISRPIKFNGNYVIFKILDIQEGAEQSFPMVKERIRRILTVKKTSSWLKDIVNKYGISIEKKYENLDK
jgi:hypothetical protein